MYYAYMYKCKCGKHRNLCILCSLCRETLKQQNLNIMIYRNGEEY